MKRLPLFLVLLALAASVRASEQKMFVVPLAPLEQQLSARLQVLVDELKGKDLVSEAKRWTELRKLPRWVFNEKKREVAYLTPQPAAMDAFRYAIVLGTKGDVVIVRAGGLDDRYEFFALKRRPNQSPEPTALSVTPRADARVAPASTVAHL